MAPIKFDFGLDHLAVEATKKDLPKGGEAQCPICWRMFTSDSTCELHKPYRKPIADNCKEPSSIGLVKKIRRDLAIWASPSDEGMLARLEARRASGENPGTPLDDAGPAGSLTGSSPSSRSVNLELSNLLND